ncbi:MAG TPA: ABC transporter permease [Terriglobales bacterium]|jgi:predicted permease
MESFLQDLRFGVRMLWKNATSTAVATLTLALGIGATTAIFSIVSAMLLRSLPVADADQLVAMYSRVAGREAGNWSYPQYRQLRESGVFQGVSAQSGLDLSVTIGTRAELLWANIVSENYFSLMGMKPVLGRLFQENDDGGPGSDAIVVLSYDCWQQRFAGDPNAIGRKVLINGNPFVVVGVAPRDFHGVRLMGYWAEMWVPLMMYEQVMQGSKGLLEEQNSRWLLLMGRMQPGMNLAQAQERTSTFALHLGEQQTTGDRLASATVIPAGTQFDNPSWVSRSVLTFGASLGMGATLVILLVACSNVANLLLARASTRRKEIATRLALGATRERLVRQMLTESMAMAVLACPLGIALARLSQIYSSKLVPPGPFRLGFGETVDPKVVWFAVGASLATVILFGLTPALRSSRMDLVSGLKNEVSIVRIGRRRLDLRSFLVVVQTALAAGLLISAGLFTRSLSSARNLDLGFRRNDRFVMSFDLSVSGYDEQRGDRFQREVLRRVRALPGVRSASMVFPLPLDYESSASNVFVAGKTEQGTHETDRVWSARVDPGYFSTMGTAVLEGREFTDYDDADAPPVVIVNQTMAKRYWQSENAIGREIRLNGRTGKSARVVGVAQDGKYVTLGEAPTPALWMPLRQNYAPWVRVVVETVGDPAAELGVVRKEIQRMDPNVAVFGEQTMNGFLKRALNLAETEAYLGTTFGIVALVMAAVGLFGVMSFSVAQRTRELGIRMALGARRSDVLTLVLRQVLRFAGAGIAAGTLLGLGLAQVVRSLLYGISPYDAQVFLVTAVLLTLVALAASCIPALRATKVDPLVALRYE